MSLEIVCEIAGAEPTLLRSVGEAIDEAEVEYTSGLGGLEILGTIAIPSVALALQVFAMVRDARKREPTATIVQIHIYRDERQITINAAAESDLDQAVRDAVARLQ